MITTFMTIEYNDISKGASSKDAIGNILYVKGYEDQIHVLECSHGTHTKLDSETNNLHTVHNPLTITKNVDKTSPLLMNELSAGMNLGKVIIDFYRNTMTSGLEHYYYITLHDTILTGAKLFSDEHGDAKEKISFSFKDIEQGHTMASTYASTREYVNPYEQEKEASSFTLLASTEVQEAEKEEPEGLTIFLGGAGMRGKYQYDMVNALIEAGISNVARGNYSAFFNGHDEEMHEQIDILSDSSAVIFYNQDTKDPIALQFVDTRGCEPDEVGTFLNLKYRSYKGKTIKNEECPNAFYFELEADSDVKFDLKTIGVNKPLPKKGQFNFIGYSWGSVIASRTALEYARKGTNVDNLVLIGSPINYSLLQAVQEEPNIKNVIVINLDKFGDPTYAGMTDTEIIQSVPILFPQMKKGTGHFYYSAENNEGKIRRRKLAKDLYNKGLK